MIAYKCDVCGLFFSKDEKPERKDRYVYVSPITQPSEDLHFCKECNGKLNEFLRLYLERRS